jgi:hypothetical protein
MFKGAWLLYIGGIALAAAVVVGVSVGFIDIPTKQASQACAIGTAVGAVAGAIAWAVQSRRAARSNA